jgi:hypothetical protein
LNFRESQRTSKSPFRECECHLHSFKVGLRKLSRTIYQFNLWKICS